MAYNSFEISYESILWCLWEHSSRIVFLWWYMYLEDKFSLVFGYVFEMIATL
jgi:hypothetical protein